jgi:uncharacterized membrane protein YfcA
MLSARLGQYQRIPTHSTQVIDTGGSLVMVVYVGIGLVAGILSGIFGIGGGIVIVPSLVFFAHMSQKAATGTSLAAIVLPVGALGLVTYWRAGQVDVRAALSIALFMLVGAYAGSLAAQAVSDATLKKAFAVLLVGVAARLWFSN